MRTTTNPHLNPLPRREGEEDAKRLVRERRNFAIRSFILRPTIGYVFLLCLLVGCEASNYAPQVTSQLSKAQSRTKRDVDLAQLEHGRALFVHRCIECHTLPPIWKYSREDWPQIVNDMSHRASLKPTEREAVIAYILAVRATER